MQKRYVPITVISVVLGLVAVIGYMQPKDPQAEPVRVLFDNSGGKVIFTHLLHTRDYGIGCEECHHESETPSHTAPVPCGKCHPKAFDEDFARNHISSFKDQTYCERCHHEGFDGMDSLPCSECHEEKTEELVPTRMETFHRCTICHEELGAGPTNDQCTQCHMK